MSVNERIFETGVSYKEGVVGYDINYINSSTAHENTCWVYDGDFMVRKIREDGKFVIEYYKNNNRFCILTDTPDKRFIQCFNVDSILEISYIGSNMIMSKLNYDQTPIAVIRYEENMNYLTCYHPNGNISQKDKSNLKLMKSKRYNPDGSLSSFYEINPSYSRSILYENGLVCVDHGKINDSSYEMTVNNGTTEINYNNDIRMVYRNDSLDLIFRNNAIIYDRTYHTFLNPKIIAPFIKPMVSIDNLMDMICYLKDLIITLDSLDYLDYHSRWNVHNNNDLAYHTSRCHTFDNISTNSLYTVPKPNSTGPMFENSRSQRSGVLFNKIQSGQKFENSNPFYKGISNNGIIFSRPSQTNNFRFVKL